MKFVCHSAPRCLIAAVLSALVTVSSANPTGAQVVQGQASFNQPNPGVLEVHNSPGAILQWRNFSIGSGEWTKFIQQSQNSVVLNRIVGARPSAILGRLSSNGRVFLINPNGIVFGAGSQVNTAGLLASTLNISDDDFLRANLKFEAEPGRHGRIENHGYISVAHGGEIILLASTVENRGVLSVEGGRILLAAGEQIHVNSLDFEDIEFTVEAPSNSVLNLGELLANGGSVGLFAGTLRNTGVIHADRAVRGTNGEIWLEATESLELAGNLRASGGEITVTANKVSLRDVSLSTDAPNGGGHIRIGGGRRGAPLAEGVANASLVSINGNSRVSANAEISGDGGEIVVWSEVETVIDGDISARAGPRGGDGGAVETSSSGRLSFSSAVDVAAPRGSAGEWLIDPEDIDIGAAEAGAISTALNAGSHVSVETGSDGEGEGNITVSAAIEKTEGDAASLSMTAHNKIDVNAPITATAGTLDVSLTAGSAVNINAAVESNGGNFSSRIEPTLLPEVEIPSTADTASAEEDDPLEEETTHVETQEVVVEETTDEREESETESVEPNAVEIVLEPVPSLEPLVVDLVPDLEPRLDALTPLETLSNGISVEESVTTLGGDIFIDANANVVIIEGTLNASNTNAGMLGGSVDITGNEVVLEDGALIDARGGGGGGSIRIGGGINGNDPSLDNADRVNIHAGAAVHSDGLADGDGGSIVVYGKTSLHVGGVLSARGGTEGGDGGFIETSALDELSVTRSPDVSSPNGEGGEWLIDPLNYDLNGANWTVVKGTLTGGNTVTIHTNHAGVDDGDITVSSVLDYDGIGTAGSLLNLFGDNDVLIHKSILDGTEGTLDQLSLDFRGDCNYNAGTGTCTSDGSGAVVIDPQLAPAISRTAILIDLQGGDLNVEGAGFTLKGSDSGNYSATVQDVDTFDANIDGAFTISGGSAQNSPASITTTGNQTIIAKSFSVQGPVKNSDALLKMDGTGVQQIMISDSGAGTFTVGSAANHGDSQVEATGGLQDLDVDNMAVLGGVTSGPFMTDESGQGWIISAGSQDFDILDSLDLDGGDGEYYSTLGWGITYTPIPSSAAIMQLDTDGEQNIVVGGDALVQGGGGTAERSGNNVAYIEAYGRQELDVTGTLTLAGGVSKGNTAQVLVSGGAAGASNADRSQTLRAGELVINAGPASSSTATISNTASGILYEANSTGNFVNQSQLVDVAGNATLTGGTALGYAAVSWIRQAGYIIGSDGNMRQTVEVGTVGDAATGDLTLNAGSGNSPTSTYNAYIGSVATPESFLGIADPERNDISQHVSATGDLLISAGGGAGANAAIERAGNATPFSSRAHSTNMSQHVSGGSVTIQSGVSSTGEAGILQRGDFNGNSVIANQVIEADSLTLTARYDHVEISNKVLTSSRADGSDVSQSIDVSGAVTLNSGLVLSGLAEINNDPGIRGIGATAFQLLEAGSLSLVAGGMNFGAARVINQPTMSRGGGVVDASQRIVVDDLDMTQLAGGIIALDIKQDASVSIASGYGGALDLDTSQSVEVSGEANILGASVLNYSSIYDPFQGFTKINAFQNLEVGGDLTINGVGGRFGLVMNGVSVDAWIGTLNDVDISQNVVVGGSLFAQGAAQGSRIYQSPAVSAWNIDATNIDASQTIGVGVIPGPAGFQPALSGSNDFILEAGVSSTQVKSDADIYVGGVIDGLDISQNVIVAGDLDVGGGSSVTSLTQDVYFESDVSDAIMQNVDASQNLTVAGDATLHTGDTSGDAPKIVQESTGRGFGNSSGVNLSQNFGAGSLSVLSDGLGSSSIPVIHQLTEILVEGPMDDTDASQNFNIDGDLIITAGNTIGSAALIRSFADVASKTTVTNSTVDQTITAHAAILTAGAAHTTYANIFSLGFLEENFVKIHDGTQTLNLESLTMQGGDYINAVADIYSSGGQNVTTTDSISISGGTGQNGSAWLEAEGDQSITTSSIVLNAGTGLYASAYIGKWDPDKGNQTIEAEEIRLTGSASGNRTYASIDATGNQSITVTGAGGVTMIGGVNTTTTGLSNAFFVDGNSAYIGQFDATSTQSIDITNGALDMQGGSGLNLNSALIINEGTSQHISVAGNVTLTGGQNAAGGNNQAVIHSEGTSTVDVGGETMLQGGLGTGDVAMLRAGTTMTLNSTGDINLVGGSGSGASAEVIGSHNGGNTVYMNAGSEGNSANVIVTPNAGGALIMDNNGTGTVNMSYTNCFPAGSCATSGVNSSVFAASLVTTLLNVPAVSDPPLVLVLLPGANGVVFVTLTPEIAQGLIPIIEDTSIFLIADVGAVLSENVTNDLLALQNSNLAGLSLLDYGNRFGDEWQERSRRQPKVGMCF